MRKNRKKFCGFLLCMLLTLLPASVWANPCYTCTVAYHNPDFQPDSEWLYEFTYGTGEVKTITEAEKNIYLLVNGNLIFTEDSYMQGRLIFVPVRNVGEALGDQVSWNSVSMSAEIQRDSMAAQITVNRPFAVVQNKSVSLSAAPVLYNNRMYLSAADIPTVFQAEVVTNIGLTPFQSILISVDNRSRSITRGKALYLAKSAMEKGYSFFVENSSFANRKEDVLDEISEKIKNMKLQGELAGHWVLQGPYTILADKATGELYFYVNTGGKGGNGSYMEKIVPVDITDENIFVSNYFAG